MASCSLRRESQRVVVTGLEGGVLIVDRNPWDTGGESGEPYLGGGNKAKELSLGGNWQRKDLWRSQNQGESYTSCLGVRRKHTDGCTRQYQYAGAV